MLSDCLSPGRPLVHPQEREKSAWPYRVLARADEEGKGEQEERFVVLKREPNHFVLVKTALPPAEKGEGKAGDCGGDGSGVRAPPPWGWGQACFRRSELPEAVKRLWQIEPEVARAVLPPPPSLPPRPPGAGQTSSAAATVTAAAKGRRAVN